VSTKEADLDILAEAFLPSDLLTPTLGSNYGLDGYEDMQYGMGVLEGVLNPELMPAPALPTGLGRNAAEATNVAAVMEDTALADLDWLDPKPPQDEERLPKDPHKDMIPELVQAWGVNRRTDGLKSAYQTDLDRARYEHSLEGASSGKKANERAIKEVVTRAMRRSIEGRHIVHVVREACESMGAEFPRIVPHLRLVQGEHGLVGNVFIRAAAYPGWGTGKWKKHAKKHAADARYIIVSEREREQGTWIQDGRCAYTGKRVVTAVPWREAYSYYSPRLLATGRKVATGDVREALRQAFLTPTEQNVAHGELLPRYKAVGDGVSLSHAREALDASDPTRKVVEVSEDTVRERVGAWRVAQMLSAPQAERILTSDLTPNEKMSVAVRLVSAGRRGDFSGASNRGEHAAQERQEQRLAEKRTRQASRESRLRDVQDARRDADLKARVAKVTEHIERGARGSYLRKIVSKLIPQEYAREATRLLRPVLEQTGALNETPRQAAAYDGPAFEVAQASRTPVKLSEENVALAKAASDGGTSVSEIQNTLRWVRRAMSEGMAGKDLTDIVQHRFADKIVTASVSLIADLRTRHEGASGFLYVDAGAYATPSGVKGCEKGALRHRANQIPTVAEMDRCASCTMVRDLEDGSRKCAVYNKTLLPDTEGDEIQKVKQANIATADMTDAEATASMFAPTYDPAEFGLRNSMEIEVGLPENEKVADITFGNWDL